MARRGEAVSRQSPTPTGGQEGSDLRTVAGQIEGLLDDDGHFNPDGQKSRGHPDYDESSDPRTARETDRDERGRFRKKAAPTPEAGEQDTGQETDLEAEDDQLAAGDVRQEDTEDTDTGDAPDEQAASADEEAEQVDAETGTINTLAELADALEVPIEELQGNLTHTFRAAGEDVTVNLQELVAGYQKDADYRRQTTALAEQRRTQEAEYSNRIQQFEQQHVITAGMMQAMENMLQNEFNSEDLNKLRQTDPAEWAARREEIGQRWQNLQQARTSAAQQYDNFRLQEQQALRARESKALTEKLPDFGDDQKQLARKTMSSLGFADNEILEIFDHRLVVGALELAGLRAEVEQLRAEKANAKDVVKRVKKDIPRLQKPGRGKIKSRGTIRRDSVKRLRQRAAKSGTVDDAAKVIESMMR